MGAAKIGTIDGQPTRVEMTMDNSAAEEISEAICRPAIDSPKPDVYAPSPLEYNCTFRARVTSGGSISEFYPATSRFGERIAHGWVQRVEAAMTEAATTAGTPHGDLYGAALQNRELVYGAYNQGDWAKVARLAKQGLTLCEPLKQARLRRHNPPDPE